MRRQDSYMPLIIAGVAAALWLAAICVAQAKDCYVERYSRTTVLNCDDGKAIINEDNTRDRTGRRDDMPSRRREPTILFEDGTRCSQTGSIYRCR